MIILQITEMYGSMHRNSKHSKWKRFLCPLGHIILLIYVSVSTLQTERFYYNIPTVCPRKTLYAWTLYLETYVYYENRVFWVFVKQLALLEKKKKRAPEVCINSLFSDTQVSLRLQLLSTILLFKQHFSSRLKIQ